MSSATGCLELLIACQCWGYPDSPWVTAALSTLAVRQVPLEKPTENVFAAVEHEACRSVISLVGWVQRISIINF